jgi:hypothetical protein
MGKQKFCYSNIYCTAGFQHAIRKPAPRQCVIMRYGDKTCPTDYGGIIPYISGEIKEELK